MSKCRIALSDVGIWIYDWNEAHPDLKMNYFAWENHVEIARVNDAGGIDEVICSGRTAREAWEQFRVWKNGYYTGLKDRSK